MLRRPILVAILLVGALWLAGCTTSSPGRVSLTFTWLEAPPVGAALWAAIQVQDAQGTTIAELSPATFVVGEPFVLPQLRVAHGTDRVVVVELRERESLDARVLYFGRSARFSLSVDKVVTVEVALALQRPATDAGNALGIVIGLGGGLVDPAALTTATLRLESVAAVAVELSNDPSLQGARTVALGGADTSADLRFAVGAAFDADCHPERTCCELSPWDMTAGAPPSPPDGVYSVFARFIDSNGYPSPLIVAKVQVDNVPPVVVYNTVTPAFARAGQEVVVSVTANEPLASAVLTVSPPPVGFDFGEPQADATTWQWRALIPDTDDTSVYSFSVAVEDRVGNALADQPLRVDAADPASAPLTLAFDASPPAVSNVELTVSDEVLGARQFLDGGTVRASATAALSLRFDLGEDRQLAGPPSVTWGRCR
jgi:hypothetical protein